MAKNIEQKRRATLSVFIENEKKYRNTKGGNLLLESALDTVMAKINSKSTAKARGNTYSYYKKQFEKANKNGDFLGVYAQEIQDKTTTKEFRGANSEHARVSIMIEALKESGNSPDIADLLNYVNNELNLGVSDKQAEKARERIQKNRAKREGRSFEAVRSEEEKEHKQDIEAMWNIFKEYE